MATEDGEDIQRAEKATLKRKLTGPPRLLLGKTRTRSVGEDRSEARTDKDKTENSAKYSAAAESDAAELTETANMDEGVSPEVTVEGSGGCCGAAGEADDVRNRKVNRRRWWRRFSPAVVCNRKPKKDVEESLEKQKKDPPEGALQETDTAVLHHTEEDTLGTKGKRRFNVRTWPTFRRFLTPSNVQRTHEQKTDFGGKDGDEVSMTFQKKMRMFFTKEGKSRSSGGMMKCEEAACSPVAQVDEPTESHDDETVGSLEVETVAAEMSLQPTEKRAAAESPDQTPTRGQPVCDVSVAQEDLTDSVNGPETIQTDSEAAEGPTDTNGSVKDLTELEPPEKDEVFCDSTEVVPDAAEPLSASTTSSPEVCEVHCEERTGGTASRSLQPSVNGPSIRIELVPPDDVAQEDGEDECWGGSSSSENHNHLLLLLGFQHSEQQLVQTARSLVRAAVNAAVDQLTREQQSDSDCVHREPPGCRDHA